MAALTVDFAVDPKLTEAIAAFKASTDRALFVGVENEKLVYVSNVPGTQSETVDMSKVRTAASAIPAAFIVFRRGEGQGSFALIMYISDDAKPKIKMLYSASASHLRKTFAAPFSSDKRVNAAAELTPALFAHESSDRQELMTESERHKAQIAAVYKAEQEAEAAKGVDPAAPRALPGMASAVDARLSETITRASTAETNSAVFLTFEGASTNAVVTKEITGEANALALLSSVAADFRDQPLFVFLRCDSLEGGASEAAGRTMTNHFVYYCPAAAKPKDKMRFSASKGSIVMHIKMHLKIALGRSIEIDEAERLVDTLREVRLEEAPAAASSEGGEGGAAKKPPVNAGFRLPGMGGKAPCA